MNVEVGGALRIVFDFGGVLFNWRPLDLVRQHFPQHAIDDAAARATVAAVFQGFNGDWAQFDRGLLEADVLAERITARTGLPIAHVRGLVHGVPQTLTPKADTVALLQRLHATGVRLHFLSNMPRVYAEHLDRMHPELMACFHSGVYSAHVQLIKPEEAMFRLAGERFGVPGHRLLLLDDVAANVSAARAHGWHAVQFSDAAACEATLRVNGWWPQ
jgi:putative hydrolase of the HAD superfamily